MAVSTVESEHRPTAAAADRGSGDGHPRRRAVFAVVTLGAFMAQLDLFIVNIAFPAIGRDFPGASAASLSWILDAYAIVFAACLVPAGRLGDLIGRRRTFAVGIAVFALASAGCAAAPSVWVLVLARVVQAIGAALVIPSSLGLLMHVFSDAQRPVATGLWASAGAVAAACGPPLGGVLVLVSWRLIFVVNLPLAALALLFTYRVVPEVRHPDRGGRPDLVGVVLLIAAVAGLVLCIVKGDAWGFDGVRFIGGIVICGLLLAAFVRRCAVHPAPVVELSLLSLRPFAVANAVMLAFYIGYGATLLAIVLFLTEVWHVSTPLAGLMFAACPGTVAVLSSFVKRLITRFGAAAVTCAGCLAYAAGAAWWLWRTGAPRHFALDLLPGELLVGVGTALTQATLYAVIGQVLPSERFGTGSGVLNMARQIAIALGVAVLVALLGGHDRVSGFHAMFAVIVMLDLLAAGLALALPGRLRARPADR